MSRQELYDACAEGWVAESAEPVWGEVNPAFTAEFLERFPDDGLKMWFAVIRRK